MSPTQRKVTTNGWERWRGATDERLKNIETGQDALSNEVKEVKKTSQDNNVLLRQLVTVREATPESERTLTFKWVLEKIGIPLMLGINTIILGLLLAHLFGGG